MTFDIAYLNWVEGVWLVVSGFGLYFGWTNLQEAKRDRAKAEEVQNGLREARIVVADGYVFRNRIRVGIFGWWVLLGIMFGFFDPPDVPRIGGLLGLIVTAVGFAFKGMQESSERRTLRAIIAKQAHVDTVGDAAATIKERAAQAAAQLEVVAQEAALRLREFAQSVDQGMAADQRRSADAAERTADSSERLADSNERIAEEITQGQQPQPSETEGDPR